MDIKKLLELPQIEIPEVYDVEALKAEASLDLKKLFDLAEIHPGSRPRRSGKTTLCIAEMVGQIQDEKVDTIAAFVDRNNQKAYIEGIQQIFSMAGIELTQRENEIIATDDDGHKCRIKFITKGLSQEDEANQFKRGSAKSFTTDLDEIGQGQVDNPVMGWKINSFAASVIKPRPIRIVTTD